MAGWLWVLLASLLSLGGGGCADVPCAARWYAGNSPVCVCNATYCDTVTREPVPPASFVLYVSSRDGLRFSKSAGAVESGRGWDAIDDILANLAGEVVMEVRAEERFQSVAGFGGSVTDAAAINWRTLSSETREHFIRSYYSEEGLEYNMMRVPIGGCDFSERPYAFNEYPEDDAALSNYTLTVEDTELKLPMIHAALSVATEEMRVVASTWSPPLWMKTNDWWHGFSRVKPEYFQTFADYHIKFLELYAEHNVSVWALTTTNEPINGVVPLVQFNSLGWTPSSQARWVIENLGPTLRNSQFADVKILAVDDQRYLMPIWINQMVRSSNGSVLAWLDGIALHYYGNFAPPALISAVHDAYPGLFILSTEACEGPMPWQGEKVQLGAWHRAVNYAKNILEDLNHWVVGWIDWNLCLSASGGPNWADNFVDAPVIVPGAGGDEFLKQPMFYALGHFSKFVARGSVRVRVQDRSARALEHAAFLTPRDTTVLVILNRGDARSVRVLLPGARRVSVRLPAASIATLEIAN